MEQFRIALITLANPLKNFVPSSKVLIESNSSNEAPAQNVLVPSLLRTIIATSEFLSTIFNSLVNCCNNALGKELLAGCENVIVAIVFSITVLIEPDGIIIVLS